MGLEAGTYISDLNASNPVGASDPKSQGDNHLRLIKSCLLASFPGITGAMTATHTELNYLDGVTGKSGTGNLVLSASPTITGTLVAAAITATSYDGIAAANLLDKSAAETISGAWDFAAITASSYDGITAANLLDKSAAETISGAWDFAAITASSYDGITAANLLDKSAAETISGAWDFAAITATSYDGIAATNLLDETAAIDDTVSNTTAAQPGYKGIPQRSLSASASLALTDCAKRIYLTGGSGQTLTIPSNASVAFPIGTAIEIINDGGADWSIAITTDTLEKLNGATGTQTLPDNNKAILEKVTATLWKYSATA